MNHALFLCVSDLVLTAVALRLASSARLFLPWGGRLRPGAVRLNIQIYVLVLVVWLLVFLALSVYDTSLSLRLAGKISQGRAAVPRRRGWASDVPPEAGPASEFAWLTRSAESQGEGPVF